MSPTLRVLVALTTAGILACGRSRSPDIVAGAPRITLDTAGGARSARIIVSGLSSRELDGLRAANLGSDAWQRLLRVTVTGADTTPIAGRYAANNTSLEFRPAYPFDPGRPYAVVFDPGRLPESRKISVVTATVALAPKPATPPTVVVGLLPAADTLPENLLRLYIQFSAPMSRAGGMGFIKLLDTDGREVRDAFLPLDADFWNTDRTRYTLFLDPGRVKRGILPNEQMGRALRAGRTFTLEIDRQWRDAEGQPLAADYRHAFRAGPPVEAPIDVSSWRLQAPRRATTGPLVATFPRPLDPGLLDRALGVESAAGSAVDGTVTVDTDGRAWRFTPRAAWRAGPYRLVVLSILEDVAGNRIGRAFEVDQFERADRTSAPDRYTIPFTVP